MKLLKMVLIIIAIIIAIPLLAALFIKKDYTVQRTISVNAPTDSVYQYVSLLRNQDYYNKWVMMDPQMKKDFTGTDGNLGFIYAWDSQNKNAGKGAQEITKLEPGKQVESEVRFEKPMKAVSRLVMDLEPKDKATGVVWTIYGHSNYPMNFMNIFMDKMLGNDMDTSLQLLKTNLEPK